MKASPQSNFRSFALPKKGSSYSLAVPTHLPSHSPCLREPLVNLLSVSVDGQLCLRVEIHSVFTSGVLSICELRSHPGGCGGGRSNHLHLSLRPSYLFLATCRDVHMFSFCFPSWSSFPTILLFCFFNLAVFYYMHE